MCTNQSECTLRYNRYIHVTRDYIYNYNIILLNGTVSEKMSFRIYMGQSPRKGTLEIKTKCYKISLRLNHYSVRTVIAIDFLFSILHTIPFLYGKIFLGVLHMLHTSIATFDTPPGPNPP